MRCRGTDRLGLVALVVALAALVAACSPASGAGDVRLTRADDDAPPVTDAPPDDPTTSTSAPPPTSAAPTTTEPPAPPVTPQRQRHVHEQAWTPFAEVGPLVLRHPAARVERVGFHQANHDGARDLQPLPTAASPITLESRERETGPRTAADVVVDPQVEIRAPVTGRVLRAGSYVLYCDHSDDFVVIEPDARPGWEVKLLHIDGVQVRPGMHVHAGETVLAPRATVLPFESQVEEVSAEPPWPHVHIEVVDPSIPDRPSGGGGC